jgi:hypothetical protein
LVLAIVCEAVMLAVFLYVDPLARVLGQAAPNRFGFIVAILAIPSVLLADVIQKRIRNRASPASHQLP